MSCRTFSSSTGNMNSCGPRYFKGKKSRLENATRVAIFCDFQRKSLSQRKIHSAFADFSERELFYYQDIKLTWKNTWHCNIVRTSTKILNCHIREIVQILLIQSQIFHKFHYHVDIISELMTELVTELVGTSGQN